MAIYARRTPTTGDQIVSIFYHPEAPLESRLTNADTLDLGTSVVVLTRDLHAQGSERSGDSFSPITRRLRSIIFGED
jgi:hypothetical protein